VNEKYKAKCMAAKVLNCIVCTYVHTKIGGKNKENITTGGAFTLSPNFIEVISLLTPENILSHKKNSLSSVFNIIFISYNVEFIIVINY
jgi:hypothetical protein